MKSSVKLALCLVSTFLVGLASAQQTTPPNAYVYVISTLGAANSELVGYRADSTGALTPLSGSPFWKTSKRLFSMAHTANWLFVSDLSSIYSFSIASNGALKLVSSVDATKYYAFSGLIGVPLILDHTGSTLYSLATDGPTEDNQFQFFAKNSTTGTLSFFGSTDINQAYTDLIFTGNNRYAYGFACFRDQTLFSAFKRGSDGTLTPFNATDPIPSNPTAPYCQTKGAADPANHLAVAMYLQNTEPTGPPAWLGVYSADSSGNLTTNSTRQNMPMTSAGQIFDMVASPAGNLLAVGGGSGLQIFHFNGSNPITPYTGLLAVHIIDQIRWDNHDHLYGISRSGLLYAFKITATGHKQAAGSPYSIPFPRAVAVISK